MVILRGTITVIRGVVKIARSLCYYIYVVREILDTNEPQGVIGAQIEYKEH